MRLNAFASLIDIVSLERVLKPFEPLKEKEHWPPFADVKAMFSLYLVAFAPAPKPYRIGLLFTHKNGDFGAISKVESHISDRCAHYTE